MKEKISRGIAAAITSALLLSIILSGCSDISAQNSTTSADLESDFVTTQSSVVSQEESAEYEVEMAVASSAQAEADLSPQPAANTDSAQLKAKELLNSMTLKEKIYQLFIVTQEQLTGVGRVTQSGKATKKALERQPVGGIIYFEPNIVSPDQCSEMIQNIQSYSSIGLFIAVDEEGGRVARLGNNPDMGTTAFPGGQAALGQTGDPEKAHTAGRTIGSDLVRFGFNLNLAPVAEITDDVEHSVIGERSFGGDPEMVAQMVAQMVKGLHEGGVLCTIKHFPGHGDTTVDPHNGYAEMTKSLEELEALDFVPFRAGAAAGADFLMMGHFAAPQVTGDDVPATLSDRMIALAREELNFEGIIMTDSLSMGAITDRYSSGDAAVAAIRAGADILLMPANLDDAVQAIEESVENGTISEARIEESVEKIITKKLEWKIIV